MNQLNSVNTGYHFPKRISKMKTTKILNLIVILFLIANLGVAIFIVLNKSYIILHWDILGHVTNYGAQQFILVLPLVSCLIYAILRRYIKDPYKMNYIGSIVQTEQNATLLRNYLDVASVGVTALLLYVTMCSGGLLSMSPYVVYSIICVVAGLYIYTRHRLERA